MSGRARSILTLVAAVAAALFATPLSAQRVPAAEAGSGCTTCHGNLRTSLTEGVHGERGITCVTCHGGDAEAVELPEAHRPPFRTLRGKTATALSCGSCHSDPNQMRAFGLPSGQLAEFRTSRHGQLLFGRNDENAPTCTNCHGTHIIYPPEDGRSRVYPTNLPQTCAECHTDRSLMARYKLPIDQHEQFKEGRHGVALFQELNFAAPTCVGCHGAHSALPPGVTEISNVCSQCHASVGQALNLGPHGPASRGGKLSGCLGCHSNHGTKGLTADSLAVSCVKCHADDSKIRESGVAMQRLIAQATNDLSLAERAIEHLQRDGMSTGDLRFRYQSALSSYTQMAKVQHSLDMEELEDLGRRVRSYSVQLGTAAEHSAERRWEHKLLLLPVWFLALSAVALVGLVLRGRRSTGAGD